MLAGFLKTPSCYPSFRTPLRRCRPVQESGDYYTPSPSQFQHLMAAFATDIHAKNKAFPEGGLPVGDDAVSLLFNLLKLFATLNLSID